MPNSSSITPPITGSGIDAKNALNLPKNAMQMANTAAHVIMTGLLFLVIITAPVTSPYVVTGGPPIKPATHTPKPSPASVLSNPGSAA